MRGAVSNAICTTVPNNALSHWPSKSAPQRPRFRPNYPRLESSSMTSLMVRLASEDLQEISQGIHPSILSKGGLGPAIETLARRSCLPVKLDLRLDRPLADSAELAAYYVVAEALTNVAWG
jgi:signal transduction histidine kinase